MERLFGRPGTVCAAVLVAALVGCEANGGPQPPFVPPGQVPGGGGQPAACTEPIVGGGTTAAIDPPASASCLVCSVTGLNNIVDADLTNFGAITQTVGALGGSIGVTVTAQPGIVFSGGQIAGFTLSIPPAALTAQVIPQLSVSTLLNGTVVDTKAYSGTLNADLLQLLGNNAQFYLGVTTKSLFNAVRLVSNETIASAAGEIRVYSACSNGTGEGSFSPLVP